jgi:N utilization substance protein A
MKSDLSIAIKQLVAERNLPKEVVLEAIEAALVAAYKKMPEGSGQNVSAELDPASGRARVFAEKEVVEEVSDPRVQISLAEARAMDKRANVEDRVRIDVTPRDFGRIAAQTAKQVILQRIREAERDYLYRTYAEQQGEIVNAMVQSLGTEITLNLGKVEAILPRDERVSTDHYRVNQRLRVYILDVTKGSKGPQVIVSRRHPLMLRRLLELEVPEIFSGTVEIKAIAREAGSRSKVAVTSRQEGIDAVGACVGVRGVRIQALVNELGGEKIDVVEWNPEPSRFIANALSPASVIGVTLEETRDGKTANVVVPDKQLSLAIGKEGQNARLAAKLTGWRIDIRSESEALEEVERRAEEEKALAAARALLAEAEAAAEAEGEEAEVEAAAGAEVEEAEVEAAAGAEVEEAEAEVVEAPEAVAPEVVAEEEPLVIEAEPEAEEVALAEPEAEPEEVAPAEPEAEAVEVHPSLGIYELAEEWLEEEEEEDGEEPAKKDRKKRRKQRLMYDEELGEVVAKRVRKPGRRQVEWEE